MNVPKIDLQQALQLAHEELNRISAKISGGELIQHSEVQAALKALRKAADDLEGESFDSKFVIKHHSFFEMADKIRNSPNLSTALGIYQLEFSGILHRIETIIRKNKGMQPVSKVGFEKLDT